MALLKYLERKRSALPDERACSSTSLREKDLKRMKQCRAALKGLGGISREAKGKVDKI